MPTVTADQTSQLMQPDQGGQFLFVNNDEAQSVYISQDRTVAVTDPQIAAQASAALTGTWYVSTLTKAYTVQCFVLPGGSSWSNPIGVQIALDLLGLARDSTVAALPTQIQTMGAPPFIPNVQSYGVLGAGPGGNPHVIVAAVPADTFIWYAHLSFAGSSNASHVGNDHMFAQLHTGSGKPLIAVEIAVGDAASADSGDADLSIGGLPLAAGDTVTLDVNNGNVVTNVIYRASCTVLVGTP